MKYHAKKNDADYWIEKLSLVPHPEGGYFKETFMSSDIIDTGNLPREYDGTRKAYTSIYFLLKSNQISSLHRLKSDEIWCYHSGSPVTIHVINSDGAYYQEKLGSNPENQESFQVVIPAGSWFGAMVEEEDSYSLVGCFVSPGFDFKDFELADRTELIKQYPEHRFIIEKLTKP